MAMGQMMLPPIRDLVLVGGGHTHVAVLRQFGMRPLPGVRLTLISRDIETPYSGMLPGVVAGHYSPDAAFIDLGVLSRFAGARTVVDEAIGLDLAGRRVLFRQRPPLSYDVLSLDIGSTLATTVPGVAGNVIPVKPIDGFLSQWQALCARVCEVAPPMRIAVVGGGAGGIEIALAAQYRIDALLDRLDVQAARPDFHVFTQDSTILSTYSLRVQRIFGAVLGGRGVTVHTGSRVTGVGPGWLRAGDEQHDADVILWVTDAAAAGWLRESGLAVDGVGFVQVGDTLESVSHPGVFAAGDVAAIVGHPRPKAGVFAVREGPVLARNLRRALLGRSLTRYKPQRRFLSLISTGDVNAVASRGPLALAGPWVWHWKDWIDRRFMRKYQELPDMRQPPLPVLPRGLADEQAMATISSMVMRCGGCGAKVGAPILSRVLAQLPKPIQPDVRIGLEVPDDAAVIDLSPGRALVQTIDFFRAMIDDPYIFGQISAAHALGDIYAMGATPQSALALVTIPYGPESKIEETLMHLMAGATKVLGEAGTALVGGHTGEGAELAMGFSVTGMVDPVAALTKTGLRPGDQLILTKPVGTGTLFAADMRHRAKGRWIMSAVASMLQSSRAASRCLLEHGATACTDVTGFGLLGHLVEMLNASGVGARLALEDIPILDGAEQTVRNGILSSLQAQNVRLRRTIVDVARWPEVPRFTLLFDPQTAGGLLAGVPGADADRCVDALRALGYTQSAIIGTVVERGRQPEFVQLDA